MHILVVRELKVNKVQEEQQVLKESNDLNEYKDSSEIHENRESKEILELCLDMSDHEHFWDLKTHLDDGEILWI